MTTTPVKPRFSGRQLLVAGVIVVAAAAILGRGTSPGSPTTGGRGDSPACQTASRPVLDAIATGLTVSGGGSLSRGAAVRSPDHEKVWYVAAEIDGPGMEGPGEVGVWATNELAGGGIIMSVDALAREFSDWPDGGRTDARLSVTDTGAREAVACL